MRVAAITALAIGVGASSAAAQINEHIYRVVVSGCDGSNQRYSQTAFKTNQEPGLITALHGVAGCSSIVVFDHRGGPTFNLRQFRISRADVRHDVAEIVTDMPLAAGGLVVSPIEGRASQRLRVYGFPSARAISRGTEVRVADPPLIALQSWKMSQAERVALDTRRSPDPTVSFIDIDGTLLPGHSGAPLLSDTNQVVAVANGGLDQGRDNRSWAASWPRVALVPVAADTLKNLGRGPAILFAVEVDLDEAPQVAAKPLPTAGRSVTSIGRAGPIPGLRGVLNPILDTSNRTYLYARNVAIDNGQPQPVTFAPNQPLLLEDADGNRFSVTVLSIMTSGSTLAYEKLPSDTSDDVGHFDVRVQDDSGRPVAGANVEVTYQDATYVFATTGPTGGAAFERLKRPLANVVVSHPNFHAVSIAAYDLRRPLAVMLRVAPSASPSGGTLTLNGNIGEIPGLVGRFNTILDSSKRTYLYASNIAIAGGQPQPVPFELGRTFEAEDSRGNRTAVTVTSIGNASATVRYERLAVDASDDVGRFEVHLSDRLGVPVNGATVFVAFRDGTVLDARTTSGVAVFQGLKQPRVDVLVAREGYPAIHVRGVDGRRPLPVRFESTIGPVHSVLFMGRSGLVPGLAGSLNPILDTSGRMYVYARDMDINGGQPQPVTFALGVPFTIRDATGATFEMRVLAIPGHAALLEYRRLSP